MGPPQQRPQGQRPPPRANAPFTAFAGGNPPQLQFGQQPRPGFFGQPQQVASQPRPQQLGIPPQLAGQQPGGRFQPFGRPPPQQGQPPQQQQRPSSPFAVFNPNLLRGARFF